MPRTTIFQFLWDVFHPHLSDAFVFSSRHRCHNAGDLHRSQPQRCSRCQWENGNTTIGYSYLLIQGLLPAINTTIMIMIGIFFEFKELGTSAIDPHILFHPPRSYLHSMVGDSSDRVSSSGSFAKPLLPKELSWERSGENGGLSLDLSAKHQDNPACLWFHGFKHHDSSRNQSQWQAPPYFDKLRICFFPHCQLKGIVHH